MRDALLAFLKGSPPVTWVEIVKAIEPDDETALRGALSVAQADGKIAVCIDPARKRATRYTLAPTTTAEIVRATPSLQAAVHAVAEAAKTINAMVPPMKPVASVPAAGPALILEAISNASQSLKFAELLRLLPSLSTSAVRKGLQRLSKAGKIVAIGNRGGTRWMLPGATLSSAEPPHSNPRTKGQIEAALSSSAPTRADESKPARMRTIEDVASKHVGGQRHGVCAAPTSQVKVRAALEINYATSRDAVDVYLASVVDPVVYEPLRRSRDEAKEALDRLISGGA